MTLKPQTKQEKAVRKLRRFINGIINKLTEDTKDRILGEVKELYDVNDTQLVTNLLLDCVFNHVMANHLKISFQLPLFTSFLTAVHALVGDSMATATVHKVFDQFLSIIEQGQDLDWNKQSHNVLLVVVYLTMLNVLDLSLVVDLVQFFLRPATFIASVPSTFQRHRFFTALQSLPEMLRMEYVDMILCRVGDRIRREDPATVQDFVQFFHQQLKTYKAAQQAAAATGGSATSTSTTTPPPFTRMQFLYESLADFDCKRMQRVRDKHFEEIKEWRKWLSGNVQRLYRSVIVRRQQDEERRRNKAAVIAAANNGGGSSAEVTTEGTMAEVPRSVLALVAGSNAYASHNERLFTSATIVIPDKDVDIATAAALLHTSDAKSAAVAAAAAAAAGGDAGPTTHTSAAVVVEQIVAKKGQQLRLNTPNRKAIFGVLMTCRDLEDAYEKIIGLHLGATMDRDLVRVLMECAGKEWPYNPFYAELLKLFCTTMPACKLTTEIAFYDEIAMIVEQEQAGDLSTWEKKQRVKYEQRVMNLARLLADLLMQFKLTLAVLRKVDLTWIADVTTAAEEHPMLLLFLSTLFVSMFTYDNTSAAAAGGGGGGSSSNGATMVAANDHEGLLLSVCDRLGRSKHYDVVRHVVMHFLETHLKKLPSSIEKDSDMALRVKKGRKIMLKSMKDMEILHQYTSSDTTMATGFGGGSSSSGSGGRGKGDDSHDPFDAADEAYFRSRQEKASGKKQRGSGKKSGKNGGGKMAGGDIGWEMAMGSD